MDDYFKPIEATNNIADSYKDYIISTFNTDNDVYNEQIRDIVNNKYEFVKGPYFQLTDRYLRGKTIRELTDEYLSKEFLKMDSEKFNPDLRLYIHQQKAFENIIEKDRSTVVSTGTGSGKTESFMIPIFNHIMGEIESGTISRKGVRAMLIYPMNALVNDQIKRFKEDFLCNYSDITFGFFTGETIDINSDEDYQKRFDTEPSPNEVYKRSEMRTNPPHILITNYAMLEHILIRPENSVEIFNPASSDLWKYIVLDEAHTYGGAKGAEASMLMRRVKATLHNNDIRFILTSATLGSDGLDKVAEFANNLTGSVDITPDDVIFATRDKPQKSGTEREVPMERYREILESNFDEEVIFRDSECIDAAEALAQLVLSDTRFWAIRESLEAGIKPLVQICEETGIPDIDFIDFVNVASHARVDNQKVFDARYHTFIRSMDGIFITLAPSNKVTFDTCSALKDEQLDEEFVTYQLSACYNCNAIFIPGKEISREGRSFLTQLSEGSVNEENESSSEGLYMLSSDSDYESADDEEKVSFFHVCSKCGRLKPYSSELACCGGEYQNVVYKVVEYDEKEKLCKCPRCEQVNTKFGIVRDYYLGPEAASSVIGSSLFMEIPKPPESKGGVRQFLMFSDSRKSASYAAVNLDRTHENLLMHRIIAEVVRKSPDFTTGISYNDLLEEVRNRTISVYNASDRDSKSECNRIAKRALFREYAGSGSNKSLEYSGLFRFESDVNERLSDLSIEDTRNLINQCLKIIREKGCVHSSNFNDDDIQELFHATKVIVKRKEKGKGLPNTTVVFETASMINYLTKIFEGNKTRQLSFVDKLFQYLDRVRNAYSLNADKQYVVPQNYYYYCPKCYKRTPYSVKDICPNCCEKTLVRYESDFETSDNHYIRMYREMPFIPLRVKEHTAQLRKEKLTQYQRDFIDQKYNALSCSTTFEMGIDIGSLSTVFMRNVPPAPSNYIQRAGRAGRSINSSAFIVTFCKNSSHDRYYFSEPQDMIDGVVATPIVNPNNPKIAIRHIFASAIGHYWKSKCESPKQASQLVDPEYMEGMKHYLSKPPESLRKYLRDVVPKEIQNYFDDDVPIGLDQNLWVNSLLGEDGRLALLVDEFNADIGALNDTADRLYKEKKSGVDATRRTIATLNIEDTLSFLSRGNVIPKYGFPVETVYLEPISRNAQNSSSFELQRDLSIGISEYAPECQIVADGKLITSYNIKNVKGREWDRFAYVRCPECNTLSVKRFVKKNADYPEVLECENCQKGDIRVPRDNCFLVPKFGFQFRDSDVRGASINKPRISRGRTIEYKGNARREPESFKIGSLTGTLEHNRDDELISQSNDTYNVCECCGYATRVVRKNERHKLPWSEDECANKVLNRYHLGYTLRTDVCILHFDDRGDLDENGHLSVMYALVEALALEFNIERKEIDGCLRSGEFRSYDYVLFDDTPGGAGYVKSLKVDNIQTLVSRAVSLLSNCTCGGENGDGSCYGCLRNFRNQKYHDRLSRGVALRYLKRMEEEMADDRS